ncbi:hypothetical protein Tco_0308833 [Tanacetum coccineum]
MALLEINNASPNGVFGNGFNIVNELETWCESSNPHGMVYLASGNMIFEVWKWWRTSGARGGKSMIGSLMYLTASRPDIMFACKKQTVVATSTTKAEYVAASSCCGQVLWIQNQLLDYGYNFMEHCISKEVGTPRYLSLVVPLTKVSDESVHKELGDKMERAATTASSLEAEQDNGSGPRCQDTILGDVNAQTRFEITSIQSIDLPLSRGYTLRSGEDSMKLIEIDEILLKLVLSVLVSAVKRMLMLPVQVSVVEGDSINTLIKGFIYCNTPKNTTMQRNTTWGATS